MTKVAFCFPGQGSLEVGMGREIAEAVPEAMEVYRIGSEATGMDLAHLCFESPLEDLVETEVQQPTLVATSPGTMNEWLSTYLPMRVVPDKSKLMAAISEP